MTILQKCKDDVDRMVREQAERLKKVKLLPLLRQRNPKPETELYDTCKGPFMDIQERKKK